MPVKLNVIYTSKFRNVCLYEKNEQGNTGGNHGGHGKFPFLLLFSNETHFKLLIKSPL